MRQAYKPPTTIEGWPVHFEEALTPEITAEIHAVLSERLKEMATVLPSQRVGQLRAIPIYVDLETPSVAPTAAHLGAKARHAAG